MGMADDDLEYYRANSKTLVEQEKKLFYNSGYLAGSNNRDETTQYFIRSLEHQSRTLWHLIAQSREQDKDFWINGTYIQAFQQLNEYYDHIGYSLFSKRDGRDVLQDDAVQGYFRAKSAFLYHLKDYPELFMRVIGCNKRVPDQFAESITIRVFQKSELSENEKYAVKVMEYQEYKELGLTWKDKFECVCDECSACCGNGCSCSYEHLDLMEFEFECQDQDECDLYEHSQCVSCLAGCECC